MELVQKMKDQGMIEIFERGKEKSIDEILKVDPNMISNPRCLRSIY